jgi:hypothetical protein
MKLWIVDWNEDVAPSQEPMYSSPFTPVGNATVALLLDTSARLNPSVPGKYVEPDKLAFAA